MSAFKSEADSERIAAVFQAKVFVSGNMTIPRHDVLNEGEVSRDLRRVEIKPIRVKGKDLYQFGYVYGKNIVHKNLDSAAAKVEFETLISTAFKKATLHTVTAELSVKSTICGDIEVAARETSKPAQEIGHDRVKHRILPDGEPVDFLIRLGVMSSDGRVVAARYDKFKQINRFLELVSDSWSALSDQVDPLTPLHIVDFGSGKSYLTFALYYYLKVIKQQNVIVTGLDLKADVISECAAIARDLRYDTLSFKVGDIAGYQTEGKVDMVVSLHACDTATDDALRRATDWNAKVIMAVPCCQHELYGQIRSNVNRPLLKHGILKERLAALVTDALRAEWLETQGYSVQVLEFIETAHTPKNLLIRAVHTGRVHAKSADDFATFRDFWQVTPHIDATPIRPDGSGSSMSVSD